MDSYKDFALLYGRMINFGIDQIHDHFIFEDLENLRFTVMFAEEDFDPYMVEQLYAQMLGW